MKLAEEFQEETVQFLDSDSKLPNESHESGPVEINPFRFSCFFYGGDGATIARWRPERHVELMWCDGGIESLIARYLNGFTIDGLEKPWRALAASWKKSFMSKVFGVPAYYLYGNNNFLLVSPTHLFLRSC